MYTIVYAPEAKEGLAKLKRSEPASFKKAVKLLNEIAEHPKTGTGHPEPLKGQPENRWSRQITKNIDWSIESSKQKFTWTCSLPMGITTTNNC